MFFKKVILSIFATLCLHGSAFCFTIINQTNSERVLRIQEAYRPQADKPGNLAYPVPFDPNPHEISIPANSAHIFHLREPCTVLLVDVVTIEKTFTNTTTNTTNTTTNTATTCYGPYGYQGSNETLLTDEWGLIIHKPIENQTKSFFDRYNIKQDYGIKCLHPKLLEKVTSLEELPEELMN